MGDRVAIIGGKTVGRDHFPYPTVAYDVAESPADFTVRPYTLSAAIACKWFYIARDWDVAIGGSWTDALGTDGSGNISFHWQATAFVDSTFPPPYDPSTVITPSREAEMILPKLGVGADWNDTGGGLDVNSDYSAGITDYASSFIASNHVVDFLFGIVEWSSLSNCLMGYFAYNGSLVGQTFASYPGALSSGTQRSVGSLTIDGEVSSIYTSDHVGSAGRIHTMNLTMTPRSLWPYG